MRTLAYAAPFIYFSVKGQDVSSADDWEVIPPYDDSLPTFNDTRSVGNEDFFYDYVDDEDLPDQNRIARQQIKISEMDDNVIANLTMHCEGELGPIENFYVSGYTAEVTERIYQFKLGFCIEDIYNEFYDIEEPEEDDDEDEDDYRTLDQDPTSDNYGQPTDEEDTEAKINAELSDALKMLEILELQETPIKYDDDDPELRLVDGTTPGVVDILKVAQDDEHFRKSRRRKNKKPTAASKTQEVVKTTNTVAAANKSKGKKKKRRRKPSNTPKGSVSNKPASNKGNAGITPVVQIAPVKSDLVSGYYGACSVFEEGEIDPRVGSVENCGHGWQDNNKQCANTCRVKFIEGDPYTNYQPGLETKFYQQNKQWTRCEACLLWARYPPKNSKDTLQRNMLDMKKGAPVYCDLTKSAKKCKPIDDVFRACMGSEICANHCWSPESNSEDCNKCYLKFCVNEKRPWWSKYFKLCHNYPKCKVQYNPDRYKEASGQQILMGQACWGEPETKEYRKNKEDFMSNDAYCKAIECRPSNAEGNYCPNQYSMPYPKWIQYFKKCEAHVCSVDGKRGKGYDKNKCEAARCAKVCLESGDISEHCKKCRYPKTNCKSNQCLRAKDIRATLDVREACLNFAHMKTKKSSPKEFDIMKYQEWSEKCNNEQVYSFTTKECNNYPTLAGKVGEREFTSSLGVNIFRENYEGWGAPLICKIKYIILACQGDAKWIKERVEQKMKNNQLAAAAPNKLSNVVCGKKCQWERKKNNKKRGRRSAKYTIRQIVQEKFANRR